MTLRIDTFPVPIRWTLLLLFSLVYLTPVGASESAHMQLHDGWELQSSCKATQSGEVISSANFKPSGWYPAIVPTTVLAAEVAVGKFKDPYFGDNLRKIPGTSYPIGENFAELPM